MTNTATDKALSAPAVFKTFWFWAGVIVLVRIFGLIFADGDLGPDEAQYWTWAQDPAFGYFSKPPMISWIIAATTGLFGDGEWAVRLGAPLFHGGAALFIYLIAEHLYDRHTALFAGLGWLTLPGVSLSSFLITTDAPLLFFWSGALFFALRIVKQAGRTNTNFLLLGVFIGLGLLSKYAMLYFATAFAVCAIASPVFRSVFFRPQLALTISVAGVLFAPNIAWNAANDFQTVAHTAANANWTDSLFKPGAFASFLGGQLLVFGPILATALVAACYALIRNRRKDSDAILLVIFTMTPIVIVAAQAFISRAHANWAAAAYPSGVILASAWLLEKRTIFAKASLALHTVIAAIFLVAMTSFSLVDRFGAGRTVAELRGWRQLSQQVATQAEGYDAVLFDDRSMIAEMLYYQRGASLEIAALDPNNGVDHHYEAFMPFRPDDHKRSLFVSILSSDAHVNYRFHDIRPLGAVVAPVGPQETREFALFAITDYYGPPGIQYTD